MEALEHGKAMQDGWRTIYEYHFSHETGLRFNKGRETSIPCHGIYVVYREIKPKLFALIAAYPGV